MLESKTQKATMRYSKLMASLVVLPLFLSGCGADNTDPQQTASQAPLANTPATPPSVDYYTITDTSAGPVQLGMLSSDILALIPDAKATIEQDAEGIEWMTLSVDSEALMNIMLDRSTHSVSLIRIISPRFITKQGVKVGENLQSVGEKLGGLREIQLTEIESREFATFTNAPVTMVFQVVGKNSTAGIYPSAETITAVAAPSATIHSIWLMED
jgi:hypothetical protein